MTWQNDILMIKGNKLFNTFFCFFVVVYSKRNLENLYSVFLLGYRNAHGSLGELKRAVETLVGLLMLARYFFLSQTSTHVSIIQQKQDTCYYS